MPKKITFALVMSFGFVIIATSFAYRSLQRGRVSLHAARRFHARGLYEDAAKDYYRALHGGMEKDAIAGELISLYYVTGNNNLLTTLKKRSQKRYDGADTLERVAKAEYIMGDFMNSANTYALAAAVDSNRKYLYVELARSLFFAGRHADSVRNYQIFLSEKEVEADENVY